MAALLTGRPYLAINSTQAKGLASALANVAKQYKVEFNPAIVAWLQLAGISSAVYAPMVLVEIKLRQTLKAQQRATSTLANAGNVAPVQMTAAPKPEPEPESGTFRFQ